VSFTISTPWEGNIPFPPGGISPKSRKVAFDPKKWSLQIFYKSPTAGKGGIYKTLIDVFGNNGVGVEGVKFQTWQIAMAMIFVLIYNLLEVVY